MTKDKTLRMLMDPNVSTIDVETENYVLTSLIGRGDKWPATFKSPKFNPSASLLDALALMAFVHPNQKWALECIEPSLEYKAWVIDDTSIGTSWNPARAIVTALWIRYCNERNAT